MYLIIHKQNHAIHVSLNLILKKYCQHAPVSLGHLLLSVFCRTSVVLNIFSFSRTDWPSSNNFDNCIITYMRNGEQNLWISLTTPPWGLRGVAKFNKINVIFKSYSALLDIKRSNYWLKWTSPTHVYQDGVSLSWSCIKNSSHVYLLLYFWTSSCQTVGMIKNVWWAMSPIPNTMKFIAPGFRVHSPGRS